MKLPKNRRLAWVEAALGKRPCDLVLRDARVFDVFACRWLPADIAVFDGRVVGLEPGLKANRTVSAKGKFVVPGFIDAHVHLESSMMAPENFQRAVLPHGTTTAICDPHELANVQGVAGIRFFLKAAQKLKLDLRVMLSSCVPATDFETNGAGHLPAKVLQPLRKHAHALGLAEVMNVPGVLHGDREVWDKLRAFENGVIDGHCPLLRGRELSAYAAAGISSCHESTQLAEAAEKLTKGLAVWIREGSVAKDLAALAPLLTVASSARIGFCTDDRNPLDIANEGHIDHLVRTAIRLGVPMEAAYRSASWTVARHYGLSDRGAIAPGYRADLVLLGDRESCAIDDVWINGERVAEADLPSATVRKHPNTIKARAPRPEDLQGPTGRVHVIGVEAGKILTSRRVDRHDAAGVARLSVLERYGHKTPPANAYVSGFGVDFRGAIASSVGHDSHNLIVVGSDCASMAAALKALIASGGGYAVANQGQVQALLPLPLGGLMSDQEAPHIRKALENMYKVCKALGCLLPEPFLQLAFLSLPVIPSLKLTDQGLVDVEAFKLISVSAA
jgi:adenine deaminase